MATKTKTKIPANERGLLGAKEAAEYLSISRATFMRLVSDSNSIVKPIRLGSTNVRYRVSDLDRLIESLVVSAGEFNGDRVKVERHG